MHDSGEDRAKLGGSQLCHTGLHGDVYSLYTGLYLHQRCSKLAKQSLLPTPMRYVHSYLVGTSAMPIAEKKSLTEGSPRSFQRNRIRLQRHLRHSEGDRSRLAWPYRHLNL